MPFTINKFYLLLLLAIAALLLGVGLFAPIITFKKFIFIQNTFSILTACWNLLKQGQVFLFVVIALFSIILPIFKIALLTKLVLSKSFIGSGTKKVLALIHRFGRWSMLDVFVVAILVVVVKLGAIGDVEKHIGLYAYAGAAILIMVLTKKVVALIEKQKL
jgi:paraquat-inducible protein A